MTTLVLLPGLDGSGDFFDALCHELPCHWRTQVVRYPSDQSLGYSELTALVRQALPTDGSFVLLAESFSGPVAIQVAATHPRGLIGLVLCATFARNPRPVFRFLRGVVPLAPVRAMPVGLLAHWLLGSDMNAGWTERIRRAMDRCSVDVLRRRAKEVLSADVRPQLKEVLVPAMYLQAKHDRVVPVAALTDVQRVLPGIRVTVIDGPHFLLQARPRRCAQELEAFVEPHISLECSD